MSEGRFKVVREPQGYSVIDSHSTAFDRRVAEFTGKTAREKAWAEARKRSRESLKGLQESRAEDASERRRAAGVRPAND